MSNKFWVLNEINRLNKLHSIKISRPEPVAMCNFTEKVEVKSLMIKYIGDVVPCQFFYQNSIGNIFESDIPDILSYENLKDFYISAEKRKEHLKNSQRCKSCAISERCSYGCAGIAAMLGNPNGLDGECEYRIKTRALYSNNVITVPSDYVKETLK